MNPGELQRAIDFLAGLEPTQMDASQLPDRPDYAAIARLAVAHGWDLEDAAVQEAFRLMMQVRCISAALLRPG